MKRNHGWRPDLPDHRDLHFARSTSRFPAAVDLRVAGPVIFDQGQLGSCTANAISAAYQYELAHQQAPLFTPSRLFVYYNERKIEGTTGHDAGAQIRDGFKTLAQQGVCVERAWPYVMSAFKVAPPAGAYADAMRHQSLQYLRVAVELTDMKACLAAGFPFVFGFTVYSAFEGEAVAKTGVVDLPAKGEKPVGGHAVLCVGYDDKTQRVLVQNSWGVSWGQKGFFTMPYDYIANPHLCDDFWTLRLVAG